MDHFTLTHSSRLLVFQYQYEQYEDHDDHQYRYEDRPDQGWTEHHALVAPVRHYPPVRRVSSPASLIPALSGQPETITTETELLLLIMCLQTIRSDLELFCFLRSQFCPSYPRPAGGRGRILLPDRNIFNIDFRRDLIKF